MTTTHRNALSVLGRAQAHADYLKVRLPHEYKSMVAPVLAALGQLEEALLEDWNHPDGEFSAVKVSGTSNADTSPRYVADSDEIPSE